MPEKNYNMLNNKPEKPERGQIEVCPSLEDLPPDLCWIKPEHAHSHLTVLEILQLLETTKPFSRILEEFKDIKTLLEATDNDITVWAPIDITGLDKDHSELYELIKLHISPHWVPTVRILSMPSVPTLLKPQQLNGEARIHIKLHSKVDNTTHQEEDFFTVNGKAKMIRHDIAAKNGVVHLLDNSLETLQPLHVRLMDLPSSRFSILHRSLSATNFIHKLERADIHGRTFFAPTDSAFLRLEPAELERLLSLDGKTEIEEILANHFAPDRTLLSNAFYDHVSSSDSAIRVGSQKLENPSAGQRCSSPKLNLPVKNATPTRCFKIPWGRKEFRLPTWNQQEIVVEVVRDGGLIDMVLNDKSARVIDADLACDNGIIHIVDGLLQSRT